MEKWTVDEVCSFLASVGRSKSDINAFREHNIDGRKLVVMDVAGLGEVTKFFAPPDAISLLSCHLLLQVGILPLQRVQLLHQIEEAKRGKQAKPVVATVVAPPEEKKLMPQEMKSCFFCSQKFDPRHPQGCPVPHHPEQVCETSACRSLLVHTHLCSSPFFLFSGFFHSFRGFDAQFCAFFCLLHCGFVDMIAYSFWMRYSRGARFQIVWVGDSLYVLSFFSGRFVLKWFFFFCFVLLFGVALGFHVLSRMYAFCFYCVCFFAALMRFCFLLCLALFPSLVGMKCLRGFHPLWSDLVFRDVLLGPFVSCDAWGGNATTSSFILQSVCFSLFLFCFFALCCGCFFIWFCLAFVSLSPFVWDSKWTRAHTTTECLSKGIRCFVVVVVVCSFLIDFRFSFCGRSQFHDTDCLCSAGPTDGIIFFDFFSLCFLGSFFFLVCFACGNRRFVSLFCNALGEDWFKFIQLLLVFRGRALFVLHCIWSFAGGMHSSSCFLLLLLLILFCFVLLPLPVHYSLRTRTIDHAQPVCSAFLLHSFSNSLSLCLMNTTTLAVLCVWTQVHVWRQMRARSACRLSNQARFAGINTDSLQIRLHWKSCP